MEVLFGIARLYVDSKIVCFYESNHAFKTIWQHPCSCHLIKIKGIFLETRQDSLMALWHYLEYLPGVYPVTNALTIGIYYYSNTLAVKNTFFGNEVDSMTEGQCTFCSNLYQGFQHWGIYYLNTKARLHNGT